MKDQTSKLWYMPMLKGIIMILLAILIFLSPEGALLASALYIGIGFVVAGVAITYQGFTIRSIDADWGWRVFEGIIDIFLGLLLLGSPVVTAAVLPTILGFWGAVAGVTVFIDGISKKEGKAMKIILGILIFVFSSIIMFNPIATGITIAFWVGILLLITGIGNVIFAFQLK